MLFYRDATVIAASCWLPAFSMTLPLHFARANHLLETVYRLLATGNRQVDGVRQRLLAWHGNDPDVDVPVFGHVDSQLMRGGVGKVEDELGRIGSAVIDPAADALAGRAGGDLDPTAEGKSQVSGGEVLVPIALTVRGERSFERCRIIAGQPAEPVLRCDLEILEHAQPQRIGRRGRG